MYVSSHHLRYAITAAINIVNMGETLRTPPTKPISLEETKDWAPRRRSNPRWHERAQRTKSSCTRAMFRACPRDMMEEFFRCYARDEPGRVHARRIVEYVIGDLCRAQEKQIASSCHELMDLFGETRLMHAPAFEGILLQTYTRVIVFDWFAARDMDTYVRCASEGIAKTIRNYIPPLDASQVVAWLNDINNAHAPMDTVRSFLWDTKNAREVADDEWDVASEGDALGDLMCFVIRNLESGFGLKRDDDETWRQLNDSQVDLSAAFGYLCPYLFSDVQLFCTLFAVAASAQHREREIWRRTAVALLSAQRVSE